MKDSFAESSAVFTDSSFLSSSRLRWASGSRQHAAGAHDVEAAEDLGVLHPDAAGAIAAHRVPDKAATESIWQGAIVRVDVSDEIVRNEVLEVAGSDRARIHGTVVDRLRVWENDDHLLCTLRKGPLDRLRHVDLMRPLLGSNRVTMQSVHDGKPAMLILRVARRQKNKDVAVDGIAFQIAFERRAMDLGCGPR